MNLDVNVKIPLLWDGEFSKTSWGDINYIVGPNGTGKSLFAEELKAQFRQTGLKIRSLNAERLSGFEKSNYSYYSSSALSSGLNISQFETFKNVGEEYGLSTSAFIILKERLDLRIRIEALLSDIFKKRIRLVEEGGFLKPKIQNIHRGDEYSLKESECHGLKELITLLTFLYDPSNNILILDEPELHLHPQFQSFFMREVRNIAGNPQVNPSKKMFFIITHSPYFLDCKTLDDLKNVLVCHYDEPPTYITEFDQQDRYVLSRFLPRLNTHHKQFFFSPNPVFVEGYTDQQIISLLLEKTGVNVGSAGSSIIDVGGKDEVAVFLRLCKKLKIDARAVVDFDAVLRGKLREVIQVDERSSAYFVLEGFGPDISNAIGEVEKKLFLIATELSKSHIVDPFVAPLLSVIKATITIAEKKGELLDSVLLTIIRYKDAVKNSLPKEMADEVDYIFSRYSVILRAFKKANVFAISNGEIEHHYQHAAIDYLNYGKKDELFHKEFDYILGISDSVTIETKYGELISLLKDAIPTINVNLKEHMKFQIIEWIQCVQRVISKKEVVDIHTLRTNASVNYKLFSQLFEIGDDDLTIFPDLKFQCTLQLKDAVTEESTQIMFSEKTIAHEFSL